MTDRMLLSRGGGVYCFELQKLTESTTLNPTPPRWTAQVGAALVSQAPEGGVDKHNREGIDRVNCGPKQVVEVARALKMVDG